MLRSNVEVILKNFFLEPDVQMSSHPSNFWLEQNYPNPFFSSTAIRYYLSQPSNVTILIYNLQGQLIKTLVDKQEHISAGYQEMEWNGKNESGQQVSSGIYFIQLKVNDSSRSKKMVLVDAVR
jgi:hypothetical protein